MEPWHGWLIACILLLIIELFITTFQAVCVGIGCLAATVVAWFGHSAAFQFLVFSVVTLAAYAFARPAMLKYFYKAHREIKTNVAALVGRIGKVTAEINNKKHEGRVAIDGDDWRARSIDDAVTIAIGERVEVIKVDSTMLIVRAVEQ